MKKNLPGLISALTVGAFVLAATPSARAVAELKFVSGGTTVIIMDNGSGDANLTTGILQVTNLVVGTFDISVGANAVTKPIQGSATNPYLDVSSLVVSSGNGSLQVYFSDTGFGPTTGFFTAAVGGTINSGGGNLTFKTYDDLGNNLFAETTLLTNQGPYGSGAFSGTVNSSSANLPAPYSLTEEIDITHSSGGSSSFDANLQYNGVPDGGSTIALLGMVLVGIEGMRRKFFVA